MEKRVIWEDSSTTLKDKKGREIEEQKKGMRKIGEQKPRKSEQQPTVIDHVHKHCKRV